VACELVVELEKVRNSFRRHFQQGKIEKGQIFAMVVEFRISEGFLDGLQNCILRTAEGDYLI
jgi:hypothetical protein